VRLTEVFQNHQTIIDIYYRRSYSVFPRLATHPSLFKWSDSDPVPCTPQSVSYTIDTYSSAN
jgi:hypothetical protein